MNIYTRTGDEGKTSVIGGGRVAKDDVRIEAYGTIDELNSFVGQAAAWMACEDAGVWGDMAERLILIQHELFDCGSDLSYASPEPDKMKVNDEMTNRLERWIDEYEQQTPPIQRFILPGGSPPAALLHVCRTVCRRAERRVVALAAERPCPAEVRRYLNRLSDFLFTAARAANARLGVPDAEYERGANVFKRRPAE
ncbi:cob(I)yrinic acid a,c-diamide adenosyltransferase [Cohnella candidum]|uniref:Corrinoid adenosyltransferase n=1 Tax=Cohnella candidum TaxID=2674991 RepID=A0A3G3JZB7_9BACL|nr:cob(I)yrinic acid a,c-diamide adenosyltransferase [Cohnella candidum]AYQ73590.1 cob(I)yrinic acid a,c-diamide adenosyltransferase [Cohnella candidum]